MAAGLVTGQDENRLLRTHWLMQFDPRPRRWTGSKRVKEQFDLRSYQGHDRHQVLLSELHRYVQGLRETCISFCDAYRPDRSDAFNSFTDQPESRLQVVEWSGKLTRIGVLVPFLPLLTAIRRRWPTEPSKYLKMLELCERFAFRVSGLMKLRSDAGQAALFRTGYNIHRKGISFDDAYQQVQLALQYWCNDGIFMAQMAEEPSDWYNWGTLKYFLYEYEIELASRVGALSHYCLEGC